MVKCCKTHKLRWHTKGQFKFGAGTFANFLHTHTFFVRPHHGPWVLTTRSSCDLNVLLQSLTFMEKTIIFWEPSGESNSPAFEDSQFQTDVNRCILLQGLDKSFANHSAVAKTASRQRGVCVDHLKRCKTSKRWFGCFVSTDSFFQLWTGFSNSAGGLVVHASTSPTKRLAWDTDITGDVHWRTCQFSEMGRGSTQEPPWRPIETYSFCTLVAIWIYFGHLRMVQLHQNCLQSKGVESFSSLRFLTSKSSNHACQL